MSVIDIKRLFHTSRARYCTYSVAVLERPLFSAGLAGCGVWEGGGGVGGGGGGGGGGERGGGGEP